MFSGARPSDLRPPAASRLGTVYPERGVDLLAGRCCADPRWPWWRQRFTSRVADPVLEVDEPKRAAEPPCPKIRGLGPLTPRC